MSYNPELTARAVASPIERFVMTDLVDIGDHMARACECGCVRFNLLRSGNVECADCGEKQPNLTWSEEDGRAKD